MKYRMIALDLDGTLNNDDHIITPKTREALIAVQERHGVTVVLASGRQAPGLKRESDALELEKHHGLLLSYGGGRIEDATTQDVLFSRSLPNELAVRFLRHLEKFSVSPVVDNGRAIVTTCEQNYKVQDESRNNNMDVLVVDNIADAIERAGVCPVKILTAAQNETLVPLMPFIREGFEDEMDFVQSAPWFYEQGEIPRPRLRRAPDRSERSHGVRRRAERHRHAEVRRLRRRHGQRLRRAQSHCRRSHARQQPRRHRRNAEKTL